VRGFELEVAAQPTDHLSLGANLSYSSIKSKGGKVPCNDPAQPAISATNPINFCTSPSGQVLNQDAPFSATVNGGYTMPLGSMEAYFRFNLSIKGNNPNYGNFAV
jgi:iron complex outermembrane receptor protein